MAPTKPSKRPSLRARTSRPTTTTSSTATTTSTPRTPHQPTKKAKLHTRRTTFISRITKPTTHPSARSRRRATKALQNTLVTELDSLAFALDDAIVAKSVAEGEDGVGRKSMKSRPGAMKRKEKVVRNECERFGKNLAIMSAGMAAAAVAVGGEGEGEGVGVRRPSTWEALRGFIEGTMERKEEFVKKDEGEGEEMVL
ncbi:uncharacterized protein H6S33_010603 [Morchella sextelata]|uniref:uncharacterized protein n=1 Tax=Morchella sextelata TaxID=1174677 RepID=UPI001D05B5FA|nr:uncharacterized protein H6S33_010603 [Morchella sextelata]KAH0611338.1 hypothetical protein H6S33_010603 [Morchella sextelata]